MELIRQKFLNIHRGMFRNFFSKRVEMRKAKSRKKPTRSRIRLSYFTASSVLSALIISVLVLTMLSEPRPLSQAATPPRA